MISGFNAKIINQTILSMAMDESKDPRTNLVYHKFMSLSTGGME